MKKLVALLMVMSLMLSFGIFASGTAETLKPLTEDPVTMRIVGVGAFSASGPDGTINAITGLEMPGYKMIVDAFNAAHPNVTLEIEAYPWDNWQASIQTAVLAGGVDVIMHGATLTALSASLDDLIAADPAFDAQRFAYSRRRSDVFGSLDASHITGVPVTVAPMLVLINKEILANYGVSLPANDWTWADLLEIAKACTGTDPVTGEKTYGVQFHNSHSDNEIWKNFTTIGYGIGANPTIQYGATAKESKVTYNDENALQIWDFIAGLAEYTSPADREGVAVSDPAADLNIAIYFTEAPVAAHDNLKAAGVLDKYFPQSLPVIASGELQGKVTPYCGDSNLAISNTADNKEWAWEYIKFSTSNPVALEYYIKNGGIVNNREEYAKLNTLIPQEWVDAIGRALAFIPDTYSPASGMYSNNISFGNLNATIGAGMRSLLMKTGTAQDAAAKVQGVVDEYVASLK